MAPVQCLVKSLGDRIRITWSAGATYFPPYTLNWSQWQELLERCRWAEQRLAELIREDTPQAALALAQAGYNLYQYLFLTGDEQPTAVRDVQRWWEGERDTADSLEIAGDLNDLPWHLLYDRPPAEQSFLEAKDPERWKPFWGIGEPLLAGRRVNPLRQLPALNDPHVLLIVDPGLPSEERRHHTEFAHKHQLTLLESREQLAEALAARPPDLLYLFCRTEIKLSIGEEKLNLFELRQLLDANGLLSRVVLFVNGCRDGESRHFQHRLHFVVRGGLIAPSRPLTASVAANAGLDFLEEFLYQGRSAGECLQRVRARHAPHGLAYASSCPVGLRVGPQTELPADAREEDSLPLPERPYRNLAPCARADRALFTGRAEEVLAFSEMLDDPDTRLLVLHGPSGVGKTSLLGAGVLPFLEDDCPGFGALRDNSREEGDEPLFIRTTSDLGGQLAWAILQFCGRPLTFETPLGQEVTLDWRETLRPFLGEGNSGEQLADLRSLLRKDSALLGQILAAVSERLPWELVVVIDQAEELFSLGDEEGTPDPGPEMLRLATRQPCNFKLIVALGSEYFGRLYEELDVQAESESGARSFLLPEMDEERLIELVLWPTATEPIPYTSEIPKTVYDFLFEEGLAEQIVGEAVEATAGQGGALPLIQTLCSRLYRDVATRTDRVIRADDLKKFGGVAPALRKYVEEILTKQFDKRGRKAMRNLLEQLTRLHADGTRGGRLVPRKFLEATWQAGRPFEEVLYLLTEGDTRLMRWETLAVGGREREHVSLAHDAVAEVGGEAEELRRQEKYGYARIVDTLWIMIPLTVLVAAIVFTATTRTYSGMREELTNSENKLNGVTGERDMLNELVQIQRYRGNVVMAEQALRAGNVLRAHQLLKESLSQHLSQPKEGEDGKPDVAFGKLRGFEWYYLWHQAHPERRTIVGFLGTFPCIALSGDGKTLAVGGAATGPPAEKNLGVVKLYDAETGIFRRELRGHPGPVLAVALSVDGTTLASAGEEGTIKLWRLKAEPPESVELLEHKGAVRALAFSADGRTLASGGQDHKVVLWDVVAGKKREVLSEHTGAVEALAFSPKDPTLASASVDQSVILWDSASGKKRLMLKGHAGAVRALAFSRDGKTLASGGADKEGSLGNVLIWDAVKGTVLPSPALWPREVFALAFSGDDKALFVGGRDNGVWLWDLTGNKEKGVWYGHYGWVRHLAISPDGKTLVTASYDRTAKVWDAVPPPSVLRGQGGAINAVAFSGDGKVLLSGDRDGNIYLWDPESSLSPTTLRQPKTSITGAVLTRQGKLVVTAAWDEAKGEGSLTLWDRTAGKLIKSVPAHKGGITSLVMAPDGKSLASGGVDKLVKVWLLDEANATLEERYTLAGHEGAVRCVAFSPDGAWLTSGSDDKSVWVWDPKAGRKKQEPIRAHSGAVTALAFAPGGPFPGMLATAGEDRTVRYWILDKVSSQGVLRGLPGTVLALAFSADGRTLASAGSDRSISLWDTQHDVLRLTLTGHTQTVTALAFSPDGRILASGSFDGDVRLWRASVEK